MAAAGRQGAMLAELGGRLGRPDMFETAFVVDEYERGRPFMVDEVEVTALKVLHYDLDAYGFRVSANGSVLAYSGDSGPSDALAGARAGRRPLRLRGDARGAEP